MSISTFDTSAEAPIARTVTSHRTAHVIAGLAILAGLPLAIMHLMNLWADPKYQFFPMVLGVCGVLFYRRWPRDQQAGLDQCQPIDLALLAAGVVTVSAAVALFSPWLGFLSVMLMLAGVIRRFAGRELWGPWALLWLCLPLPLDLDLKLSLALQRLTSEIAGGVLDLFGVLHVREGIILELPGRRLMVEEGCSGVHSLFALIALAAIWTVAARRTIWHSISMLLAGLFWAVSLNAVRVLAIVVAFSAFDIDLSSGWKHEVLGMATFLIAVGLIASTDKLMRFILSPIRIRESGPLCDLWDRKVDPERAPRCVTPPNSRRFDPLQSSVFATVCCAMAVLQVIGLVSIHGQVEADARLTARTESVVQALGESSLPASVDGWQRIRFENVEREVGTNFGMFSKTWAYARGGHKATLSFDYPFTNWHDLTQCYLNTGWQLQTKEFVEASEASGGWPFVEMTFQRPTGERAYVAYSMFHADGRGLAPPELGDTIQKLQAKVGQTPALAMFRDDTHSAGLNHRRTYQVQLIQVSPQVIDATAQQDNRKLFLNLREHVRHKPGSD